MWVSGDLGVLQGPLDIDVLDPVTGQPAVRDAPSVGRKCTASQLGRAGRQARSRACSGQPGGERSTYATTVAPGAGADGQPLLPLLHRASASCNAAAQPVHERRSRTRHDRLPVPAALRCDPAGARRGHPHRSVGLLRINDASFAVVPSELDPADRRGVSRRHDGRRAHLHHRTRQRRDRLPAPGRRSGTTAATPVRRSSWAACRSCVRCSRTSTATRSSRTTSGRPSTRRSRARSSR